MIKPLRNIPAFTIIEAIVGMVVTAIVLAIVFVLYSVLAQNIITFKAENELTADVNRFEYSINKAIFESEKFKYSDSTLQFISYDGNETKYVMRSNAWLRYSKDYIDTFKVKPLNIIIDTLLNKKSGKKYLRIKSEIKLNQTKTNLKFYKKLFINDIINSGKYEY